MDVNKYPLALPLDTDTSDALVVPGRARFRLNCRIGGSDKGQTGSVENIKGTTQVTVALPTGNNRCVGAVEDLKGDSIVWCLHNSEGNHRIYRFYPASSTIELILEWAGFNFQATHTVFGCVVDDLLFFTDGYWTESVWNESRKLNMKRTAFYDTIKASDPYFANQLRRPPLFPLQAVRVAVEGLAYNFLATYATGDKMIYQNEEYEAITDVPANSIPDLISTPPGRPPSNYWRLVHPNVGTKIAKLGAYQFAYRYIYIDHEISTLSTYSRLIPHPANGVSTTKFIRVSIPSAELAMQSQEVVRIDFYARTGNEGVFTLIRRSKNTDAGGLLSTFDFYGPDLGEVLSEPEQVKLFDSLPITVDCISVARDRLFVAGCREDYDKPAVDITATYGPLEVEGGEEAIESQNDRPVFMWFQSFGNYYYYVKLSNDKYYGIGSYTSLSGSTGWSGEDSVTLEPDAVGYTEAELAAIGITLITYPLGGTQQQIDVVVSNTSTGGGEAVFKSSSQYQMGIVFFDYGNRNSTVFTKQDLLLETNSRIDTYSLVDNRINFSLNSVSPTTEIPIWATHYQVVIKRNQSVAIFLQHKMADCYYTEISVTEGVFVYTRSVRNTDIHVDISNLPLAKLGYVWQKDSGDRMRIFVDENTSYDLLIKGQYGSKLAVENFPLDTANTIKTYLYEIYTPYTPSENEPFYEVGACFPILNAGQAGRDYSVKKQALPGDVYVVLQEYYEYSTDSYDINNEGGNNKFKEYDDPISPIPKPKVTVEVMNPWSKYYSKWYTSAGRVNYDLDSEQVYKTRAVRFSNKYLSGTKINGLCSFEALNEKDLPVEIGPLRKLQLASNSEAQGTVLLAVAENEAVSMYLSEAQFRDAQGQTLVAVSNEVIGSINVLRGGLGTINPESVVYDGFGRIYGWDAVKGEPWRYSNDGLTALATGFQMRSFFYALAKAQLPYKDQIKVFGGYDPFHREYLMTFSEVRNEDDEVVFPSITIAFNESVNGFVSQYSFLPEMYAKSNTLFYSFYQGQLWQHNTGDAYNNFYGVQYPRKMRLVANQPISRMKVWTGLAQEGIKLMVPVKLSTVKGQESRMRAEWFENREGVFCGAIRRDINSKSSTGDVFSSDPSVNAIQALNEGDPMRSQELIIDLESNDTDAAPLKFINVMSIPSGGALV